MVFLVHSSIYIQGLNLIVDQITRVGRWGCQAFFVASGFTLALSWKNKPQSYASFLKKRFTRIAFYWYLAIIFYQLYSWITASYGYASFTKINSDKWRVLASIFFLNGLLPDGYNSVVPGGWYIGTQWIFYLLFPLFMKIFEFLESRKVDVRIVPFGALMASFTIQICIALWNGNANLSGLYSYLQYSFINQMPCFLSGVALCFLFNKKDFLRGGHRIYGIKALGTFGMASFAFYFLRRVPLIFVFVPTGYAVSFCYLILYLETIDMKEEKRFYRMKEVLICWGNISYEAYYTNTIFTMLVPFYITQTYPNLFVCGTLSYLVCLPTMMVATFISSCWLQKVHNGIKKRFVIQPDLDK